MAGSADIYQARGRLPVNSINFVTCHDGFTLNDLVSYNQKHNTANGEGNRDGLDQNLSWNCGAEGESADPDIKRLRERQVRNFFAILLLSHGVPMFLMGDEVRRTQRGNNNAYCQDNELSWFDWRQCEEQPHLLRFCSMLCRARRRYSVLRRGQYFDGSINPRGLPDVSWHGTELWKPRWDHPESRELAFTLGGPEGGNDLHVILNMHWQRRDFELPDVEGCAWHRVLDTARESPQDIVSEDDAPLYSDTSYAAQGRSVVALISKQ